MNVEDDRPCGTVDASSQAAGGEVGIPKLVDDFFDLMGSDPRFATIYEMHPEDKDLSRDKLARFLCGWLGGPELYHEKYGSICIRREHAHLAIATPERDQRLTCMRKSIARQPFAEDFRRYLMEQLFVPAEAVRCRCEQDMVRAE
jgi:hemoglobin